jgi:hypothetical protein
MGQMMTAFILAVDGQGNLYVAECSLPPEEQCQQIYHRWDGSAWHPWDGMNNSVIALALDRQATCSLVVGSGLPGATADSIARWDGSAGIRWATG